MIEVSQTPPTKLRRRQRTEGSKAPNKSGEDDKISQRVPRRSSVSPADDPDGVTVTD